MRHPSKWAQCALFPLSLLLLLASPALDDARADGLYVGHGRRGHGHPWSVRLNVSGGLHGGSDPWAGDPFVDEDFSAIGGYGQLGVEFHMGDHNSLELHGSLRELNDEEEFLDIGGLGVPTDVGAYDYELEAQSGGLTLRHYSVSRSGAAYFGVGAGILQTEAFYQEIVDGRIEPASIEEETGAEAHFLVGWDGNMGPSMTLGLELGYRHTWLDYELPRFEETGDTSGLFGGLRLGILFGR